MITFTTGDLLRSDAQALVNAVNTVGVMGKGIALAFKNAFPKHFEAYALACRRGEVRVGRMFVTEWREPSGPRFIINFPTKEHWRGGSKIEWIEEGLVDLKSQITERGIRSIALPALGAGLGGLSWPTVKAKIVDALDDLTAVDVAVFEPTTSGRPAS